MTVKMLPKAMQPKAAYILNVPAELVILFAQHLHVIEQYKLAQVSTALRNILKKRFDQRTLVKASPEEWLFYLAIRALTLPNHWVCEQCSDLHRYDPDDTPEAAHFGDSTGGCPRRATTPDFTPISSPCSFHFSRYHLHHRHVQLALKYHRMGGLEGPYADRLSRLVAFGFHHPTDEQQHFTMAGFQNRGVGRYSWEPKIVDGKFLLRTRLEFYPTDQNLAGGWANIVPAIRMCQHQMWMPFYIRRILDLISLGTVYTPAGQAAFVRMRGAMDNDLYRAVAGMRPALSKVMVSCPRCATDIEICWSKNLGKFKFTALGWHNFGAETPPHSVLWQSKHLESARFRRTVGVKGEPGRVRKLWDSCE